MPIKKPVRVGQDAPTNPGMFLVADQEDLDQGNKHGPGRAETIDGHDYGEAPLQTFFKFGAWYDIEEQYKDYSVKELKHEGRQR